MKQLKTVRQVIKALGEEEVRRITESTKQQFWNWEYFGAFPSRTYWIMTRELAKKELVAPPHLWKQVGAPRGKRAA